MASPHVNGVAALVRQACPDLTVQQVLQILYDTAHDQGPNGNDNDYGFGMVDAYEAVQLALSMCEEDPGDLNGDGCVDQQDLGILLADWDCTGGDCPGDCDGDGDTDQEDLGILLAHWGEGCP